MTKSNSENERLSRRMRACACPPVSLAVVQSAAGPQGLVVVLSPADEGHRRPEGSEEPDKHSQSDGAAPLQLCPWKKSEKTGNRTELRY